jgi:AraC family transcriptional regulator of arabinose operon
LHFPPSTHKIQKFSKEYARLVKRKIDPLVNNMDNSAKRIISGSKQSCEPGHSFRREPGFPYYTIGCLLSGRIITRYHGGEFEYQAVSLTLTPPNTPYSLIAPEAHREIWAFFTPNPEWHPWLKWGLGGDKATGPYSLPLTDRGTRIKIIRGLFNVLDYCRSPLPTGPRLAALALEQVLILAASVSENGGALDERLQRVLHAIHQNLTQPWREESMAKITNLSTSRFAHLFREKLGMPPLKFLEQLRMERAKTLLLSSATPVKEIAAEVGYPDALHFSSRFRRVVGRCPSQFRHLGA